MESVHIETTIVSYLVSRPSRDLLVAAHQQITHEWWHRQHGQFDCFISQVVIDEAQAGDDDAAQRRMEAIESLPVLEVTAEAEDLTRAIVMAGAMPKQAVRDAAHIAVAAVNSMDYLLTWNCRHLANAQVIRLVLAICGERGYAMPMICTPEELMGI